MNFFKNIFGSSKSENVESYEIVKSDSDFDSIPVVLSSPEKSNLNTLQQLGALGNKMADTYIESKRINANIKALKTQTNAVVKMHANSIAAAREVVVSVFKERSEALIKHYNVLDKALENNDRELILASLQGISSIVVSNPIEQISQYVAILQDPKKKLYLDF